MPANREARRALWVGPAIAVALALTGTLAGIGAAQAPGEPAEEAGEAVTQPCLVIRGAQEQVLQNIQVGPCSGAGIEIEDSRDLTLRNITVTDTGDSSIVIRNSTGIRIEESVLARGASGVYALNSSGIDVSCTTLVNPQGPMPRGQFIQLDKVTGGNTLQCNMGINEFGAGTPEDAINLFESRGSSTDPILVQYNLLVGGGPSPSGGGILLGDNGGDHQVARSNTLIRPGQYGIGVAGGTNMSVLDNTVVSPAQSFTNVGIYVWNQYDVACNTITLAGHRVDWLNSDGQPNPYWDAGNCGPVATPIPNYFSVNLSEAVEDYDPPSACDCQDAGWRNAEEADAP